VLLRRRDGSEEVLVSALLAPLRFVGRDPLPRAALVKVFVSKPGAPPVLHFDCRASWVGEEERGAADYAINAVRYHSSPGGGGEDEYEGPAFRWELLVSYALLVSFFFLSLSFKNTSADAVFCFLFA
jgi:complement component 1 Q subcomponent-binding protein, mitochondrial